jgi:hypothetical protein
MLPIKIAGLGCYLPERRVTNAELEARYDVSANWIERATGVQERRYATHETSAGMGAAAARRALAAAALGVGDLDAIIGASTGPQQAIPCTAALVQRELHAPDGKSVCFDVNATCLSFMFGLQTAAQLVAAGRGFLHRIVPEQSEHFLELAGTTIRAVSQGVIGVAIIQSLLAGIGLKLAGIPGAGLLAFMVMILAIVQIGAAIVLFPVIIWVWIDKEFTTALLLTVFLGIVGILDNILKPLLMARGLTTPTIVILVGVIGGTLAHGIVGLFIGPIILSLAWELTVAWIRTDRADVTLPNRLSNVDLDQRSMPRGSLSELHDK